IRFAFNSTTKPEWTDPAGARRYNLSNPEERKAAQQAAWNLGAGMRGEVQLQFVDGVESALGIEPFGGHYGYMMNWDQVRAIRKAGHGVGGHTMSHPNVAQISASDARMEILGCKQVLEQQLGEEIRHFSYPHPALNPECSAQTIEITREAGFRSAVRTT